MGGASARTYMAWKSMRPDGVPKELVQRAKVSELSPGTPLAFRALERRRKQQRSWTLSGQERAAS